jgi:hypothetical protein
MRNIEELFHLLIQGIDDQRDGQKAMGCYHQIHSLLDPNWKLILGKNAKNRENLQEIWSLQLD